MRAPIASRPQGRNRRRGSGTRYVVAFGLAALLAVSCSSGKVASAPKPDPVTTTTINGGHRDPSLCPDAAWMASDLLPPQRAEKLVAALTPEQKIQQLHGSATPEDFRVVTGIPSLCVPDLTVTNGPAGVGASTQPLGGAPATAFPAPIALAATWDPAMATAFGNVMGEEMTSSGRNLLESPDVDLARVPLNGRTFESFGEDPLLQARMGTAQIKAVQRHGIVAMVKHFVANNQETNRMKVDVQVDERTLRELYFPPFEAAVREADVASVMCAYNQVNGTPNCENAELIQRVLRNDWGFEGFVQSDFFATPSTVLAVKAGLDLEMPTGKHFADPLAAALRSGAVTMTDIDTMLVRRYTQMFRLGLFDRTESVTPIEPDAHADVARRIAEAGTVLLRNVNGALPLDPKKQATIAVVGPFSDKAATGGGGSSIVNPLRTVTPLQGITDRVGDAATVISDSGTDPAAAAAVAAQADVVVVVVGQIDSEGADRADLSLPAGQDALVAAVAAANPNTVVVIHAGAPVTMPWLHSVRAVLMGWYPGQEDGPATAALLFGDAEPGGRLPITFPRSMADLPTSTPQQFPGVDGVQTYSEKLEVGYRHYLANGVQPLFPFGFGLSYTSFTLGGLTVSAPAKADQGVSAEVTVTNTGKRRGSTVVQVYVTYPEAVGEPSRQLRGFQRVDLAAGKSTKVRIALDSRSFAYWDTALVGWHTAAGSYRIEAGTSSADVPLHADVTLQAR